MLEFIIKLFIYMLVTYNGWHELLESKNNGFLLCFYTYYAINAENPRLFKMLSD